MLLQGHDAIHSVVDGAGPGAEGLVHNAALNSSTSLFLIDFITKQITCTSMLDTRQRTAGWD